MIHCVQIWSHPPPIHSIRFLGGNLVRPSYPSQQSFKRPIFIIIINILYKYIYLRYVFTSLHLIFIVTESTYKIPPYFIFTTHIFFFNNQTKNYYLLLLWLYVWILNWIWLLFIDYYIIIIKNLFYRCKIIFRFIVNLYIWHIDTTHIDCHIGLYVMVSFFLFASSHICTFYPLS